MYGERIARWERTVEWPLMIAAILFLLAYAVKIIYQPVGAVDAAAEIVLWGTWGLFALAFDVYRFSTSRSLSCRCSDRCGSCAS